MLNETVRDEAKLDETIRDKAKLDETILDEIRTDITIIGSKGILTLLSYYVILGSGSRSCRFPFLRAHEACGEGSRHG